MLHAVGEFSRGGRGEEPASTSEAPLKAGARGTGSLGCVPRAESLSRWPAGGWEV